MLSKTQNIRCLFGKHIYDEVWLFADHPLSEGFIRFYVCSCCRKYLKIEVGYKLYDQSVFDIVGETETYFICPLPWYKKGGTFNLEKRFKVDR